MIKIKQIPVKEFETAYLKLIDNNYSQGAAKNYYLNDIKKGIEYTSNSIYQAPYFYIAETDGIIFGSIALIIDSRLEKQSCIFGFFECSDDNEIFNKLWKTICLKANELNMSKIMGPINGTIWHQYRVISYDSNETFFPSEPLCKNYYLTLFKLKNPLNQIEYHSATRTNYDIIIKHTENSYIQAHNNGITVEKINHVDNIIAKKLFELSRLIFTKGWGYVPLDFEEFLKLYNSEKIENYIGSVYLARHQDEIIGFCTNIEFQHTLVMKTIGVLPEFQRLGVANSLVHKVHIDAKQNQISQIIYALVRKENNIQYFPKDEIKVLREYVAFEFIIN
jgi:ribosomal protein S18 acetylase RimI-like enzyme